MTTSPKMPSSSKVFLSSGFQNHSTGQLQNSPTSIHFSPGELCTSPFARADVSRLTSNATLVTQKPRSNIHQTLDYRRLSGFIGFRKVALQTAKLLPPNQTDDLGPDPT